MSYLWGQQKMSIHHFLGGLHFNLSSSGQESIKDVPYIKRPKPAVTENKTYVQAKGE